jgi:hypothetical protein
MIGRFWYTRVNSLDHFEVVDGELHFEDLAVSGGLESADQTRYQYRLLDDTGKAVSEAGERQGSVIPTAIIIAPGLSTGFHGYEIRTRRGDGDWGKAVRVYFHNWDDGRSRIVRIERDG